MIIPLTGQLTGASSGLITNALSLLKYRQWGRETLPRDFPMTQAASAAQHASAKPSPTFLQELGKVFSTEGMWTRGLFATVLRDSIFGCVFTSLRVFIQARIDDHREAAEVANLERELALARRASSHRYISARSGRADSVRGAKKEEPEKDGQTQLYNLLDNNVLLVNFTAALVATTLSAPFNYARNRQYAWRKRSQQPYPTITETLRELQEDFRRPVYQLVPKSDLETPLRNRYENLYDTYDRAYTEARKKHAERAEKNGQTKLKFSPEDRRMKVDLEIEKPRAMSGRRAVMHKLRIGWGSARVGFGMAFGEWFFRKFNAMDAT